VTILYRYRKWQTLATHPIGLHNVVNAAQVVLKLKQFLPVLLQLQTNSLLSKTIHQTHV